MQYVRIHADSSGESHFEDVAVDSTLLDYAPPAPPLHLSAVMPATGWALITFPASWDGDWHPAPRRHFSLSLSGELAVETSDGERRQFGPGSVVLVEDVTGKGHHTWVVSDGEVLTAAVYLPD